MARKPKGNRNGLATKAVPPSRAKTLEITGKKVSGTYERGSVITIGKEIDQEHADLLIEKGLAVPASAVVEKPVSPPKETQETQKTSDETDDFPKFLKSEANGERAI